jgi:hypothetical protein
MAMHTITIKGTPYALKPPAVLKSMGVLKWAGKMARLSKKMQSVGSGIEEADEMFAVLDEMESMWNRFIELVFDEKPQATFDDLSPEEVAAVMADFFLMLTSLSPTPQGRP